MSQKNEFLDIAPDKEILGRPMKRKRYALRLAKLTNTYIFLTIFLGVASLIFYIANLETSKTFVSLLQFDFTPYIIMFFVSLVGLVIFYGLMRLSIARGIKNFKSWLVALASGILAVVNIPSMVAYFGVLVGAGFIIAAMVRTAAEDPDLLENSGIPIHEYITYDPDWSANITLMSVLNFVLLATILILVVLIAFTSLRIFFTSIFAFANSFMHMTETYTDTAVTVQSLETTSWHENSALQIANYSYPKNSPKPVKQHVKELFASGELRSYSKFGDPVAFYVLQSDGKFGEMRIIRPKNNIVAAVYLFNDYAYLTLKTQETASIMLRKDNEQLVESAEKCGYVRKRENSTHYILEVTKPSAQTMAFRDAQSPAIVEDLQAP